MTVPANGSIRALDASSAAKIIGDDGARTPTNSAMEASSAAKIDAAVEAVNPAP